MLLPLSYSNDQDSINKYVFWWLLCNKVFLYAHSIYKPFSNWIEKSSECSLHVYFNGTWIYGNVLYYTQIRSEKFIWCKQKTENPLAWYIYSLNNILHLIFIQNLTLRKVVNVWLDLKEHCWNNLLSSKQIPN